MVMHENIQQGKRGSNSILLKIDGTGHKSLQLNVSTVSAENLTKNNVQELIKNSMLNESRTRL